MTQLPDIQGRNPFQRAESLADLLAWNDVDFVRCAYVTMLGRQPDLSGQEQFVRQIRAGVSKLNILWVLRESAEGRQHDPGIAGLDRALRRAAWQRRPIMGVLSRFLNPDADGASRNDRALRSLMNAASVNQSYLHALGERITAHLALSGALTVATEGPALTQAEQTEQVPAVSPARAMAAAGTPELDHLRQKRKMGRITGEMTP
jgi:hypothetical protein